MAVLGFQLVSTLVAASILSKLSSHFSFGRFLLCAHLLRYLHPTTDELRQASGTGGGGGIGSGSRKRGGGRTDNSSAGAADNFTVSKSVVLALDTAPVEPKDVVQLRYYPDYQWLLDLSFCSLFVVIFNDLFYGVVSAELPRFNLTLIWCVLVVLFASKILLQLTWLYFSTQDTGEMMLIISCSFFCLLLSMGLLVLPETQLHLELAAAHANFSAAVSQFVMKQGADGLPGAGGGTSAGPISFVTLRLLLAFVAALIGACFTFPGIRYARMYLDALKAAQEAPVRRGVLHLSFFWPLVVLLTWLTPARIALQRQALWLTSADLDALRLAAVLVLCALRLLLTPLHLQAYLNLAGERVTKLRREAGRIAALDYQRLIARVFYYLCVVSLQYLAPVLLLLFVTFLYKAHGALRWDAARLNHVLPLLRDDVAAAAHINSSASGVGGGAADALSLDSLLDSEVRDSVRQWAMGMVQLRAVFTAVFCRGVLGFLVFWIVLCGHVTSAFGLLYHTYVIN